MVRMGASTRLSNGRLHSSKCVVSQAATPGHPSTQESRDAHGGRGSTIPAVIPTTAHGGLPVHGSCSTVGDNAQSEHDVQLARATTTPAIAPWAWEASQDRCRSSAAALWMSSIFLGPSA